MVADIFNPSTQGAWQVAICECKVSKSLSRFLKKPLRKRERILETIL